MAAQVGPRKKPLHEWRHDRTKTGNHDFSSTKHNIYRVSLMSKKGAGMEVVADTDQHVRASFAGNRIRLLVAHYSNGGNERYLRRISKMDDRPLEKGDPVSGSATLQLN